MQLISCNGTWSTSVEGYLTCSGTLTVITENELGQSALSPEDVQLLTDATLGLFVVVFGFLVLKKLL